MGGFRELYIYFKYFRKKVGNGFYCLIALCLAGSYLNGLSIALFLPILNFQTHGPATTAFKIISKFFRLVGMEANFTSLLILLAFTFVLKGFFLFLQEWYRLLLTADLTLRLQKGLSENYSRLNFAFYSQTKSGFFTNIFTNETGNVTSALQSYIQAIGAIFNSIVLFVFALTINQRGAVRVTLGALIGGSIIFTLSKGIGTKLKKSSGEIADINNLLTHNFIQFIVGFKYFKSIEGYFRYLDRVDEDVRQIKHLRWISGLYRALGSSIYEPLIVLLLCSIIYFQVVLQNQNFMLIVVHLFLLHRFLTSFFLAQKTWQDFCTLIGSINIFEDSMKIMAANYEDYKGDPVTVLNKGIEVKNLSFSFGDKQILRNVNLFIPKNKCIAIVGESGAGKTTLLNILTGLLMPGSNNTVFYDGISFSNLNKLELRAKFGYITQEAVVFDSTVANNISLWKEPLSVGAQPSVRLESAARKAHCLDFISSFPDGFSHLIGDRGTAISGGQRQRLMIAREIYRDPEILVFDEATSSLDSESEMYIQETTRSFLGNKTMVMVAHRMSSLRFCDYIYVLKDGEVVEQGTWAELLDESKDTYFSKINAAQKT